jgi:hypothetical protein
MAVSEKMVVGGLGGDMKVKGRKEMWIWRLARN